MEIAATYTPPTTNNKNSSKNKPAKNSATHSDTSIPDNLFDVLPFRDTDLSDKEERQPYARIPYIAGNIYHQIRRSLNKAGINACATSGKKLIDVLCGKNKTHPPRAQRKGVYMLACPCNPDSKYVGQTIRAIDSRCQEHKKASEKGNWHHSGMSQHKEHCSTEVDWENPSILATFSNKNKKRLAYDLKVREALEIKRQNCGPGRGLNEDFGAYVKTTQWNPVFHSMG